MAKINVPEINFKCGKERDKKDLLNFILDEKGNIHPWADKIFRYHPELKKIKKSIKVKPEKIINKYVDNWYSKNTDSIKKSTQKIKSNWEKIHKIYSEKITEILNLEKTEIKNITCFVSINPICPRNLKENSFSIFYSYPEEDTKVIIAHEILHFFYFEKWKKTFPNYDEKTFEAPYLIWHLSEILAPILIAHPKIQKIIGKRDTGYSEHGLVKINGKNIIEHFDELYKKFPEEKNFSEFLRKAYEEIKKYKKELNKVI